ncbi:type II secretion system F family protein [Candidatus Woesebacteria bacterium]|nr:type II secretion system F family protein [Candidatus Woesebacteria bacterium]
MPFFTYSAKNKLGEVVKGKAEASTIEEAAALLDERGLLVISMKPIGYGGLNQILQGLVGVSQNDVVNFTRQLSTMISAGLSISKALGVLVQQSTPGFSQLVANLLHEVEGGASFSKALSSHPKVFSRLYVQLVKAGEIGGILDEILSRLAHNLEKSKEFRAKTKGAMIYPVIVVIAMAVVGFVMMTFVLPKLTAMYSDFGVTLPLPTRVLIGLSNFFAHQWYVVIGGTALVIYLFNRWYKTETGQRIVAGLLLKVPILGGLLQKMMITDFVRTLSLLLGSGVTLLQALDVVIEGVDNIIYREAFTEARNQVEKGSLLSESVARHEQIPLILSQMIAVGEETGKLDEVLDKLSSYFEQETEQAVKNLTTAIEPLIMVVLAIGVGGMVIAIIMPIYSLTSAF